MKSLFRTIGHIIGWIRYVAAHIKKDHSDPGALVALAVIATIGAITMGCLRCRPVVIVLDSGFNDTEIKAAENAAQAWEDSSGGALHLDVISRRVTAVGYSPAGRVNVHPSTWNEVQAMRAKLGASGDLCGGGLTGSAVRDADIWIVMDKPEICPPTYVLFLHEFGHILEDNGNHVGEGEGVMEPNPNNQHREITAADLALVMGQ